MHMDRTEGSSVESVFSPSDRPQNQKRLWRLYSGCVSASAPTTPIPQESHKRPRPEAERQTPNACPISHLPD